MRAALGQIEGFQRVRLHAETEVVVEPDMVGDLTLMIAELLENAVSFSPAGSPVEVTVRAGGDGALIEVADRGLGMSAERLAEENARLIRRERLDLVPTKVLGLFVVGALARRWEVGVVLSRTPGGGVTATVEIPSSLLLAMSPLSTPATEPEPVAAAVVTARPDSRAVPGPGTAPAGTPGQAPRAESGLEVMPADARPAHRTARGPEAKRGSGAKAGTGPGPAVAPSGPVPSWAVTAGDPSAAERPAPLPRRVPRHESDPGKAAVESPGRSAVRHDGADSPGARGGAASHDRAETALVPRPRTEAGAPAPDAAAPQPVPGPAEDTTGASRPLRRRVRGATLRSTADAARRVARPASRPADADAVRSALEEFEAAVERAHRDSAGLTAPRDRHDPNHLTEGAEQ